MAQYEMNLRDYWFIIRRRRLIIALSTVLTALFSFWWAQQKVPIYQATAAVKYEQSTAVSGLLVEVLSYSSADTIETQVTLIKSTPVLEEVARELGKLPEARRGEPLRESKAYWATIDSINGKIRASRIPNTSIIEIAATSTEGLEAKQLANTVAEVYRRYSRNNRNLRITEARKFIEGQIKDVEARVKRAEEEVWAFREANRIVAPGAESQVLTSMLTQVRNEIEKTRQQRTELEFAQARLLRDGRVNEPVFIDAGNALIQKLQQSQNDLLVERGTLSLEYTDKHPKIQAIDDRLMEVRAEIRRQIGAQLAQLRGREEMLNRQFGDLLQKNQEVPTLELGLQRRQRDAKANEDLLTLLKNKHQEALIKESEAVEEVTIVRPAAEPDAPASTEKVNTIVIGAILGLMLGLVLAFVQETLDTSIGTIEDVETYLEVPVLGVVPHIDARETTQRLIERRPALAQMDPEALRNHALLITHFDPKSPVAEAYRTLRTNIQFARLERAGKILVVTSPTLQEGKTTTIVNLALTMAQAGQKTLLLGSNLRRPSIYRFFGIEREPGLSDILVGNAEWHSCIRTVADILMGRFEMEDIMASPGLDNLHIIESGPIPANPSELLSTRAMREFLANVRAEYDIVLIDTPPVLPVTDSAIVASQVDGVVLVYQAGKVGRLVLKRAKVHLEGVGAKVWGVVLNDVHTEIAGYQYTHYYTHYYGEETPAEPSSSRVAQWIDGLRGARGGSERSPAHAPDRSGGVETFTIDTGTPEAPARRAKRSWRFPGSRGFWLSMIAVAALAGAGALVLQMGWPPQLRRIEPKVLLRQKREATPARTPTSPPPPRPSAPASPSGGSSGTAPSATTPPTTSPAETPMPAPSTTTTTPPSAAPPRPAPPPAPRSDSSAPSSVAPNASVPPSGPSAAKTTTKADVLTSPSPPAPKATASKADAKTTPPPASTPKADAPKATATAPAPAAPKTDAAPPGASASRAITRSPMIAAATPPAAPPRGSTPSAPATTAAPRFAVEIGPFLTTGEAQRTEKQANDAGFPTVRLRQKTAGAAVYAVMIERVPRGREAQVLIAKLKAEGVGDAVVVGTADPVAIRVGEPRPLRAAVEMAERLRADGHTVRLAATPGEATTFVIRHGNFASREEAEARGAELMRLGLANQIVQVQ